jgi:hypothetical protein
MADQITKDVQSIAKRLKDDPVGLGPADEYKSIGTSRGEGIINSRGDVSGSNSEGSDDKEDQPVSPVPPADEPGDNDTGAGGGTNDGTDPADSLGGDVADVNDAITSDSTIGTMTGTDPDTGNPTAFNPTSLEDIEYSPPPDWPDPETPPDKSDIPVFVNVSNDTGWRSTKEEVGDIIIATTGGDAESGVFTPSGGTNWSFTWTIASAPAGPTIIVGSNCGISLNYGLGGDIVAICGVEGGDGPDDWPPDGFCEVTYDWAEGGYKGHENDPDCSAAQKIPNACIIIRSVSDDSRFFEFCRLANDGTKMTEVDANGVPIVGSTVKIIGNDGRMSSFTSTDVGEDIN